MADTVENKPAWMDFRADFDGMTDAQIAEESEKASREMEEAEAWLEAVASWEAAGRPRTPKRENTNG
jgi:hypothetical protein